MGICESAIGVHAEEGIRPFLDVGTGLPSANNTHEVAQAVAPDTLTSSPQGETAYLDADLKDTDEILAGDIQQEAMAEMGRRLNQAMTQQFTMRGRAQVTAFFGGLTLLDPGVVPTHQWRPGSEAEAETSGVLWAGAARKG